MGPALDLAAEFDPIPMSVLKLPFGDEFFFQYTILELNTAVKPWALEYLLDQGHQQVVYIDPDIYLYEPLSDVFALLEGGASVVLTPHLLAPVEDTLAPGDLAIRRVGTYNLVAGQAGARLHRRPGERRVRRSELDRPGAGHVRPCRGAASSRLQRGLLEPGPTRGHCGAR
jgi:hypothetical protein